MNIVFDPDTECYSKEDALKNIRLGLSLIKMSFDTRIYDSEDSSESTKMKKQTLSAISGIVLNIGRTLHVFDKLTDEVIENNFMMLNLSAMLFMFYLQDTGFTPRKWEESGIPHFECYQQIAAMYNEYIKERCNQELEIDD